jgi:hypothetical protein
MVYKRSDGSWVQKRLDSERASSVHYTQGSAQEAAQGMLKKSGGGELIIKGENGRIRDKDTVAPGNDRYPPQG